MTTASHKTAKPSRGRTVGFLGSNQGDFFQQLNEQSPPVDLEINQELLGAINTAVRDAKRRGLNPDRIVDRMNALLPGNERPITLRRFYGWTAKSKEYSDFPARYLAAFCAATDCDLPLRTLANALHLDLVDNHDLLVKQVGENLIESARLKREAGRLSRSLGA